MPNLVGKKLGKYELTERLGSGGMAEVYKAHHPTLDRYVTIKILHGFLAEGPDFLARFKREARAVASLRHPHIQQIHDFDVENDQYYMVMEFIDWGTLQTRMLDLARSGAYMPASQVLSILKQVASALDYAHQQGIIHRDIKPSNILLDSAGNAFLSDFGIARMLSETQFTATGSLIGTPTYMSPEQGKGEQLTPASDIYSLGIILYELMTGKVPFTSETTPLAIIHKHIHEPPPNPGILRPGLPASVEQVILKALAKDPPERYQSAGELVRALEEALPGEAMAALDSPAGQAQPSVADHPTELVEPAPVDRAHLPTEAISAETRAGISINNILPVEIPSPEPEKKPAPSAAPVPVPEKAAMPKFKIRRAWWIAAGGVLLLAILAFVGVSLLGGRSCSSITDCVAQANAAGARDETQASADYLLEAINAVPANLRPQNANLWCDRGDALAKLRQLDAATGSYRNCIDWTQNDPALQPLRDRANAALAGLH
jgi:serine/threonine protein kinase